MDSSHKSASNFEIDIGALFQGSESRKPNPLELLISGFEGGLGLVLVQLPRRHWQIETSFRNLLQIKNLELGVSVLIIDEVDGKVVISSSFVSLDLSRGCPRAILCHQRDNLVTYQQCP